MSKILRRNFEPGRLLLVATLLLSLTLIIQLYVISASIDFSDGLQLGGVELSLAASYLFSAVSMLIVLNEFFQMKNKVKGLLSLNQLLDNRKSTVAPEPVSNQVIPDDLIITEDPMVENDILDEKIDEDLEFESLLDSELNETEPIAPEALAKYKTTKVKLEEETNKIEPMLEEGSLQNIFNEIEEESEMDRLLSESEVIATLAELEDLVEELKHKKTAPIAQ